MVQRFKIIEGPHVLWKTDTGVVTGVTVESLEPKELVEDKGFRRTWGVNRGQFQFFLLQEGMDPVFGTPNKKLFLEELGITEDKAKEILDECLKFEASHENEIRSKMENKLEPKDITLNSIMTAVRDQGQFEYSFPNKDSLLIEKSLVNYYDLGELEFIQVSFGLYEVTEDGNSWTVTSPQYFHPDDLEIACCQYFDRLNSDKPFMSTRVSQELIDIKIRTSGVDSLKNHYDYLDLVLDRFWKLVFNTTLEESWNEGIVVAHGDKGRGYKKLWEESGISFNRGMMLYLLTYTRELNDTPKYKSKEWVIDNYQNYLPKILEAEKLIESQYHDDNK